MILMVPTHVTVAIDRAIEVKLQEWPDASARDREVLHHEVLILYHDHGCIPPFEIVKVIAE